MEVLVVVIIIGILGTLGFTQYAVVRERALGREAVATLKLIAAAQRVYRMEIAAYYGPNADQQTINDNLRLSLPTAANRNWSYEITAADADTFTATATRTIGDTPCTYTLSVPNAAGQDDDTPTVAAGTCP